MCTTATTKQIKPSSTDATPILLTQLILIAEAPYQDGLRIGLLRWEYFFSIITVIDWSIG